MEDVLVLYSSDAYEMCNYILSHLPKEKYNLRTSSLLDTSFDLDSSRTAIQVKVLILILSPGHLGFLSNCPIRSSYEEQIRNAGTTLVFLWGVGENEDGDEEETSRGSGKSLRNRIPGYSKFLKFVFEQHQDLLRTTIIKVEGLDAPETAEMPPAVQELRGAGKKGVAERKISKRTQSRQFRVIPKTARCEESTAMILCFCDGTQSNFSSDKAREGEAEETEKKEEENGEKWRVEREGKVVVTVAFGSDGQEQQLIVSTERINQNTFLFFAPEHSAGVVPIHIIMNGDVIGQSSVTYKSLQADLVLAISQIYMFLLNRLLGFLQERDLLSPEVDRRLSGLLDDGEGTSIPIQAFEQIFSLPASCEGSSDSELPTLLHLAAKFGLVDFESKLKDLPDASQASELRNHLGQTSNDLARSRGPHPITCSRQIRRDTDPNFDVDGEVQYERFFPLENPNSPIKKDAVIPLVEANEEDPYMVIPSVLKEIENRQKLVHPALPRCPADGKGDAERPPSLVNADEQELTESPKSLKTKVSLVDKIFKKPKLQKQKQVKTTRVLSPSSPSIPEEQFTPHPSSPHPSHRETSFSSSPRSSSASNSSRESTMSKRSTSGVETVDEEEDDSESVASSNLELTPPSTFPARKSSANLEQLEEDLKSPNAPRPPPPPPRRTAVKPSMTDPDQSDYIQMDSPHKRPFPGDGQGRRGPPVGPRTRKVSCPAAPFSAQLSRSSWDKTDQDDSHADTDAKCSPGDGSRPTSSAEKSVRSAPLAVRKISLPTTFSENSAQGRPLPPIKKIAQGGSKRPTNDSGAL